MSETTADNATEDRVPLLEQLRGGVENLPSSEQIGPNEVLPLLGTLIYALDQGTESADVSAHLPQPAERTEPESQQEAADRRQREIDAAVQAAVAQVRRQDQADASSQIAQLQEQIAALQAAQAPQPAQTDAGQTAGQPGATAPGEQVAPQPSQTDVAPQPPHPATSDTTPGGPPAGGEVPQS